MGNVKILNLMTLLSKSSFLLPYYTSIIESLDMPFALSQSSYPSLLIVLILPSQQILSFPQTDPPLK
ncbi:hypothetical protein K410107C12_17390 [Agathobacter rectalis]